MAIAEYADPQDNRMIPQAFVIKPGLIIHSIYNGYWCAGIHTALGSAVATPIPAADDGSVDDSNFDVSERNPAS